METAVIAISAFWAVVGFILPWLVPKGVNRSLVQCMLLMTAVCCWMLSPSYTLAKSKKLNGSKEAPLADPEPTSDISNQPTSFTANNGHNTARNKPPPLDDVTGATKSRATVQHSVASDSVSYSPLTASAPCDLPTVTSKSALPVSLQALHGVPGQSRRTECDRKIVLYVLAADATGQSAEKATLRQVVADVRRTYASRGYEVQLCEGPQFDAGESLDAAKWRTTGPMEAMGGHHWVAPCLAEIARHSKISYFVPILFLGPSLGSPLLPLTIENQDFCIALSAAQSSGDRDLLQQWYKLDETAQPQCFRLQTNVDPSAVPEPDVLRRLLNVLIELSPKELRDSYLTTLVEQEINNTVLINQEQSKRCIWVQTGSWPSRLSETADAVDTEEHRRFGNLHAELKNQLMERNLIRIPPTVNVLPDQLAALFATLLRGLLDGICEEHEQKCRIPRCTFGVDVNLLHEIEAANQYASFLEQNCVNFGIMDRIQSYVTNPSTEPLVVFGKSGCGKSVLSAKVAQNIHSWLPSCSFIIRFTNLTPLSSDIVSIVGSIAEQVCYLTKSKSCLGPHTIEFYASTIRDCLASTVQQLCILVDSIDTAQLLDTLDWLPLHLQDNVKIILTISADTAQLHWLQQQLAAESLVQLDQFSDDQWSGVLSLGGSSRDNSAAVQLPDEWKRCADKVPLQAKIYWWFAWLNEFPIAEATLDALCEKLFETLERRFTEPAVRLVLSLLVSSRYGLMETELLELLSGESQWTDAVGTNDNMWTQLSWIMGSLLLHTDRIRLVDRKLQRVASVRYADALPSAHQRLHAFYQRQPDTLATPAGSSYTTGSRKPIDHSPNRAKFCELPYHSFRLDVLAYTSSPYLNSLPWIYRKLCATGCVQLLSDMHLLIQHGIGLPTPALRLLHQFLVLNMRPLNYDARQFYSLFPAFVRDECSTTAGLSGDAVVAQWLQQFRRIPVAHYETLGNVELLNEQRRKGSAIGDDDQQQQQQSLAAAKAPCSYDAVMNLGGEGNFVASLSVAREEICVWDVARCVRVRTLRGIPQPTALCPVGDFGAAVLCRREIKVIDLDGCAFKVTLKGVMNQKMPYFGQHDATHLVCLSRNRMYVNLMNLESGDCVTTFKAGEDRFLNSLLVSGDGRILVCGDETQKPFPLLVWHLSQRKLLYDLRIPHHDFVTTLSAITHEGAYVAVVAKELNEPTPNFIVVYDLQSGTLFKKWKPSCSTVSLAISQTQACVIAGLDDARILIWDLVTGNCKYTLSGHAAPVTLLKLDPTGRVLLSADGEGRDLSVRVWDLSTGNSMAVYTPTEKITTCEILPNGRYIVLALHNHPHLVTLKLHRASSKQATGDAVANDDGDGDDDGDGEEDMEEEEVICYGQAENEGKVSQL